MSEQTQRNLWSRLAGLLDLRGSGGNGKPRLTTSGRFAEELRRERSRADRTQTPFSVIVVSIEPREDGRNGNGYNGELGTKVGEVFAEAVRCTDVVGWFDAERVGVILAHTAGADAWHLVGRVQEELKDALGARGAVERLTFQVYAYPTQMPPLETSFEQVSLLESRRAHP
jgi:GGDEF domain-containing protein